MIDNVWMNILYETCHGPSSHQYWNWKDKSSNFLIIFLITMLTMSIKSFCLVFLSVGLYWTKQDICEIMFIWQNPILKIQFIFMITAVSTNKMKAEAINSKFKVFDIYWFHFKLKCFCIRKWNVGQNFVVVDYLWVISFIKPWSIKSKILNRIWTVYLISAMSKLNSSFNTIFSSLNVISSYMILYC